jgi:hypothetical protein
MDPKTELQPQSLSAKDILNPVKQGVNLNADKIWESTKISLQTTPEPEMDSAISDINANPELRSRVVERQQNLFGLLGQDARAAGIINPNFSNNDKVELTLMAYRIENQGLQYTQRVNKITKETFPQDPEKANFIADRMIQDYTDSEYAILQHLIDKMKQQEIETKEIQNRIDEIITDPRRPEWLQTGIDWEKDPAEKREQIIKNLAQKHQDSVSSVFKYSDQQPNYTYLYLKPHDKEEQEINKRMVKDVNNAQSRLENNVAIKNSVQPVKDIPTQQLRSIFTDLDIIDQEVKIHLQPQVKDEPMAVDRLLTLLDKNPHLRDKIQAIKVRVIGNGTSEDDGNNLPEMVIYTNSKSKTELVSAFLDEFVDLRGNGLTPRFNQEVANHFVYVAQSGGDLKNSLSSMGVLDKFFDASKNYSELRV